MTNTINKKSKLFRMMVFVVLSVFTFTLTACDNSDELDYSDFSDDHLNTWQNILDKDEDQYLIYYYGVNCSHCKTIKQDVLQFAQHNDADLKVYFIESGEVPREDYDMYPLLDPQSGEEVPGTPTMFVVVDGNAKAMNVGPTIIRSLLEQINKGTYGFIQ